MTLSRYWALVLLLLLAACQGADRLTTQPPGTGSPVTTVAKTVALPSPTPVVQDPVTTGQGEPPTPTNAAPPPAAPVESAANADVTFVRAVQAADGTWTFHVTVAHPDTGWEDYADGWDVVTPEGIVVKRDAGDEFTRLLLHPHVEEQPFTRSQSNLTLPAGISEVTVRAHDLADGFGGKEIVVDLTVASGPGFEVERREE